MTDQLDLIIHSPEATTLALKFCTIVQKRGRMHDWKNPIHHRLWLQGHNGRARQIIIDLAAIRMWDPVEVGAAIATMNVRRLDTLEIKLPRLPWYVEAWFTVRHLFQLLASFFR